MADSLHVDRDDTELIECIRKGEVEVFAELVRRYQARVFRTARRYARREDEVEDIVQEVFLKVHQKLEGFRGDAPFEHWLMRVAVRTCYDFLRKHQRSRECSFTDLSPEEDDWLERYQGAPASAPEDAAAARELVRRVMEHLSPAARLVITLLEIEERSVKEIASLTGWSISLVKVRAFRARAEMRRVLGRLARDRYL